MSNTKHDYGLLERKYVSGDMSLRELAREYGVAHSLIMAQSKQREWSKKRAEFRERSHETALSYMSDAVAMRRMREMEVRDNAIEAIDEAISKLRSDMRATEKRLINDEYVEVPVYRLRPQDVVSLIDRLNVLFGRPSHITEERSLGISVDTGRLGPDALREFVEATRGLGPLGGGPTRSPIPRTDGTREN